MPPPTDCSSPISNPISSENLTLKNDQNTILDYSGIRENISPNNDVSTESLQQDDSTESLKQGDSTESLKQDDSMNMHSYTSDPETDDLEKSNQENKKKGKRKGFLQMRIDSTIYFDNMGYSYQIQNEKNDKK